MLGLVLEVPIWTAEIKVNKLKLKLIFFLLLLKLIFSIFFKEQEIWNKSAFRHFSAKLRIPFSSLPLLPLSLLIGRKSGYQQVSAHQQSACHICLGFCFPAWQRFSITLAAATQSKLSRTTRRVWGTDDRVIVLCVLQRSRSSHIWRLCRTSEGLSVDYG